MSEWSKYCDEVVGKLIAINRKRSSEVDPAAMVRVILTLKGRIERLEQQLADK